MKPSLARSIRWDTHYPYGTPVARFFMFHEHRDVSGLVGDALRGAGVQGEATFLDKAPRDPRGHLMVVGYRYGVVIQYFKDYGVSWSCTLRMCSRFRNRITGGIHKVRWAKVKGTVS